MAIGDVVNDISADNTILDFQPAAGVEVVITYVSTLLAGGQPLMFNGTNATTATTGLDNNLYYNLKMMINNTNFLRISALGAGVFSGFTGMEVN